MPSANGQSPKRVILYTRVSTDEQARHGYSILQQLERGREWCAENGYEVLAETIDAGQSGASLERPGMDEVRDTVAQGGVHLVWAQDRDRFSREPAYTYLLKREFEEHGTKMRSDNDRGDESPEGELTDGILDQLAKFERTKTAERTRRGRLKKAKEGKVVGAAPRATYSFTFNEVHDAYLVDCREAATVRHIFGMIGEGTPLRTAKHILEQDGILAPNGQT